MIKNQGELARKVTGKNRFSNIMLCLKICFDLFPQVLLIHMVGLYFASAFTEKQCFLECGFMLLSFILKALCSYSSTWNAHKSAYTSLTELRLEIVAHLKKLPLGFF
ncbi:MAG: ABC transporter ATP-binding protein, partial [Treponema sp.]|nr:ABC transporter ATP-binding protein [Treponema sp.]